MPDAVPRIRSLMPRLVRLARDLDPADFENLLGSVEVEVEAGEETLLERSLGRRRHPGAVIVRFPGPPDHDRALEPETR